MINIHIQPLNFYFCPKTESRFPSIYGLFVDEHCALCGVLTEDLYKILKNKCLQVVMSLHSYIILQSGSNTYKLLKSSV